uniref:C3 n=1 Tax=Capulavirus medicagonis TaxID=1306546 RepID=A0A3G3BIW5_9GEMI|nr:C3 [Alfalfa leaf curl virus]AYP63965.1 C3 [Alfalfa leaf curl virus]
MRPVSRNFTALSRRTRGLISRTRGSSTSRTLEGGTRYSSEPFIQTVRSQEEMQTWLTTLPREDSTRSEDFLRQVKEALRSLGIQSGQQSSMNPHPSPNSSPEYNEISPMSGPLNSEIWNTPPMQSGQIQFLCMNPDSEIFLMCPTPLENGPKITYTV